MASKGKKHTEKVVCLYCEKEVIYKNLESHNKIKHEGRKLHYKSAISKDLASMFSKNRAREQSTSQGEKGEEILTCIDMGPPSKVVCMDPISINLDENLDNTLEGISSKVVHLSSQVSKLIDICSKKSTEQTVSTSTSKFY